MITFNWNNGCFNESLAEELSRGFDEANRRCSWRWPLVLSANLAIASLLCRAADLAYQNGVDDNESEYWTGRGDLGPYPERAP